MRKLNDIFDTISILCWINTVSSVALLESPEAITADSFDDDVVQILNTKDYLPHEDYLRKSFTLKNVDNDANYILSKLSDEDLLKLLNQQPNEKEYYINDVFKTVNNINRANKFINNQTPITDRNEPQRAFFKLENKEVEPYNYNNDADPKYNALQKLNNILYGRPQDRSSEESQEKKEIIFNVLVDQLKALCCKKRKLNDKKEQKLKFLKKNIMSHKTPKKSILTLKNNTPQNMDKTNEYIFLIINDEIKSNVGEELITVDPDTLGINSSVLLLGPITTPLSDVQLKIVMSRIANELSKPEYLSLLQKISEGTLDDKNSGIKKNLITGPDSRRYIKPHRCNHQSKLARVYGGPKWLICTGYININTPSLYD